MVSWLWMVLILMLIHMYKIEKRIKKIELLKEDKFCIENLNKNDGDIKYCAVPTAEKLYISMCVNFGEVLYSLFPNSFKNPDETQEFYNNFCIRAKELREDEEIYSVLKYSSLLSNQHIVTMDYKSGLTSTWDYNADTLRYITSIDIDLFHLDKIKTTQLKKEVEHLIVENCYDSLLRDAEIRISPYGVYISPFFSRKEDYNYIADKPIEGSSLPIHTFLNAVRQMYTCPDDKKEIEDVLDKIKIEYPDLKYSIEKLDTGKPTLDIQNKFIRVGITMEYFFPAEKINAYYSSTNKPYMGLKYPFY